MMATATALRLLLPRGRYISKRISPGTTRNPLDLRRFASYTVPPSTVKRKPKVLEKPSKYNPPSHPSRIDRPAPSNFPGPHMSPAQIEARKKKKYPNMLPPEGSFMYWFLSNKRIHMYITLSVLFSLAAFTSVTTFHETSAFAHLAPPANLNSLLHPISFVYQYWQVYLLHTVRNSDMANENRRKQQEDVEKRRAYRKAHGTERRQQGPLPWFGLAEEEGEGGDKSGSAAKPDGAAAGTPNEAAAGANPPPAPDDGSGAYKDWEGRRKPVKRWLGIWT